jgi:hypothetical protein
MIGGMYQISVLTEECFVSDFLVDLQPYRTIEEDHCEAEG